MRRINVGGGCDLERALCREVEDLRRAQNALGEDLRSLRCDLVGLEERVESLAVSLECVERSLRVEVLKARAYASLLIQMEPRRVGVE